MRRIACLHTAASNVAVFDSAGARLGAEVVLRHIVRADLLADAEAAGGLTPEIAERVVEALAALAGEADAVVLTCSTLGPSVDGIARGMPVLRVDGALARQAVQGGGRVVVLCAAETTLGPTRALFETAAAETGATIETRLVPGAWAAFKAGESDRYHALIAEAADRALDQGVTRVALAQASMAGAVSLVGDPSRVLSSPGAALRAALAQ